ncbi:hypothetical protein RD110_08390 [Rhodoferax koreense]|uniref:histidine kinase n=1 Tax=Rhodoferax koreensis TaxID=1842727 RepID=A0A1P8JTW6_9BURK|nr:PAS domain S-box protein [Rhodoferax koreense]APW37216.1 hypothetical protein RD110_08390 [Rhodoferax koreense]
MRQAPHPSVEDGTDTDPGDAICSQLMHHAPDAVLAVDGQGLIVACNASACRLLGRAADEAPQDRLLSRWLVPAGPPATGGAWAAYLASGNPAWLDALQGLRTLDLRRPDGGQVRAEVSAFAAPVNGAPGSGLVLRDIGARVEEAPDANVHQSVMQALHTSEERYRAVVEHVTEGMVVIQDEVIVFANARAAEIARMPLAEMHHIGFLHRVHPDDHDLVRERQRRRLAGEEVPDHYELRLLFPDGDIRWIAIGVSVVPWGGKPASLTFFSDVTDNKLILEAMHRSEERYRAVVEHVGEGMVVVQGEQIVFVNERATAIARMSQREMLRQGFLTAIHPGDRAQVRERQRRRIEGDPGPQRHELRLQHGDGSVTWIDIGVTKVPWGGQDATLTFFSDISHRKALEEKLRDTLAERETILENSLVGIAFLTQDHRFRWSNRAMARIFAMRRGPSAPPSWEALFPSKQAYDETVQDIAEHMRRGRDYQSEMRLRRIDGKLFWAAVSGRAVDAADAGQGTVWTVMDITQRKELEEALQRTSSEREAIFNSALVGISFNVNRRIQWVNDKCVEMLGYSRAELSGQPSRVFYKDEETYVTEGRRTLEALLRDGHHTTERELVRRNGETFWVQLAGRCVVDRNPDAGVIWTLLDITDRRKAEDDIRAALARQKELNELRSRFVSMTSHEFRTPLATILSSAELIQHYADRMPEAEKQEVLRSIETGVHRMTRMLDRMLLIGKADAQLLDFLPQALDLRLLCQRCIDEARRQHAEAASEIVLAYEARAVPGVFDEKLLHHIFSNLLSNAVKYSPDGGEVRFRVSEDGANTVFEVIDQGIGIPAQELPHLFESFHRASNVGRIQGTGLGLAIVKKAVERHGGTVSVRSAPGQGTHFTVTL